MKRTNPPVQKNSIIRTTATPKERNDEQLSIMDSIMLRVGKGDSVESSIATMLGKTALGLQVFMTDLALRTTDSLHSMMATTDRLEGVLLDAAATGKTAAGEMVTMRDQMEVAKLAQSSIKQKTELLRHAVKEGQVDRIAEAIAALKDESKQQKTIDAGQQEKEITSRIPKFTPEEVEVLVDAIKSNPVQDTE